MNWIIIWLIFFDQQRFHFGFFTYSSIDEGSYWLESFQLSIRFLFCMFEARVQLMTGALSFTFFRSFFYISVFPSIRCYNQVATAITATTVRLKASAINFNSIISLCWIVISFRPLQPPVPPSIRPFRALKRRLYCDHCLCIRNCW